MKESAEVLRCVESFYAAHEPDMLRQLIDDAIEQGGHSQGVRKAFLSLWQDHGDAIQRAAGTAVKTRDFLRALLPPYTGPGVRLYRGQGYAKYRAGVYGFSWTASQEVAVQMALNFHAFRPSGGVLLETYAPPRAVISVVDHRGDYHQENEVIVDWIQIEHVKVIRRLN